jgi:FkbM family methyltransferase
MQKYIHDTLNIIKYLIVRIFGIEMTFTNHFLGKRKFYCKSRVEFFRTVNYGKEEAFLGAFLYLINEHDIIWDIGASVGLVSVYSAGFSKQVVSFEPDSRIFKQLQRNIELNRFDKKVQAINLGISDSLGEVILNSDGVDGFSPSLSNLSRHSNSEVIKVNSIDNIISEGNITKPTVLKIDIEGAEILALRGAKKLLTSTGKPRALFIEVHPDFLLEFESSADEITHMIKSYDYRIINYVKRDDQFHLIAIRNE